MGNYAVEFNVLLRASAAQCRNVFQVHLSCYEMEIEKIITMANRTVKLQFTVMERSLRATGCNLPLHVIPFGDDLFDLPANAEWMVNEPLFATLTEHGALMMCRKYLALMQSRCAYFDTDLVHLTNPQKFLASLPGSAFVVADTEWNKTRWTFTPETKAIYLRKSTLWPLTNFNAGFFAHEAPLVNIEGIRKLLSSPELGKMGRGFSPSGSDQEGTNYLVHINGAEVINLCLPPFCVESTMACDYSGGVYRTMEASRRPPFIHFAGKAWDLNVDVAGIFLDFLTAEETREFHSSQNERLLLGKRRARWPLWARVANRVLAKVRSPVRLQWWHSDAS